MRKEHVLRVVTKLEDSKQGGVTDLAVHAFVHALIARWPFGWGNPPDDWAKRPWGHRSQLLDDLLAEAESAGLIRRDHMAAEPAWTARTFKARMLTEVEHTVRGQVREMAEKVLKMLPGALVEPSKDNDDDLPF